jgi:hypothetical protein
MEALVAGGGETRRGRRNQSSDGSEDSLYGAVSGALGSLINEGIVERPAWVWQRWSSSAASAVSARHCAVESGGAICGTWSPGPLIAALLSQEYPFQLRRSEYVLVVGVVVERHVRHDALFIGTAKIRLALGNSPVVPEKRESGKGARGQ